MANSCHTDNNWCYNCTKHFSNGIIRNSKVYCSESCYDRAHKNVNFVGVSYAPTTKIIRPSSLPQPVMVQRIEKQCNYCFDTFDRNRNPGLEYGTMWFCCQHHLNLANPRPKVMVAPMGHHIMPIHIAPQVLPHFAPQVLAHFVHRNGPLISGPLISGPFIGPF